MRPGIVLSTLSSRVISGVMFLGVGIAVARALGPSGTGVHALAILMTSLIVLFTGGAMTAAVVHHASTERFDPRELAGHIATVVMVTAVLVTPVALLAFLWLSSTKVLGVPGTAFGWAVLAVATETAVSLMAALLQGSHRLGRANLLLLARATLLLIVTIALTNVADLGVNGAVAAVPVTGIGAVVMASAFIALPPGAWRPRWRATTFRSLLGYSLRGYIANITQFLNYRFDLLVIETTVSTAAVGTYSVAVRFAELLWQLPNAVAYVLFPGIARLQADEIRQEVRRVMTVTMSFTTGFSLLLALLAPVVIPAFFGEEFRDAVPALWLLLPGAVAMGATKILGNVLSGRGRPELSSAVSGGSLLATIVLDLALIPSFGIVGAAIATSLSYILTLLLAWLAYRRLEGVRP